MAKAKKAYVCSDCGGEHSKWQGQCSECGAWNTLSEIILQPAKASANAPRYSGYAGQTTQAVQTLAEVDLQELPRISTQVGELDRVLGGGLVHGSAILIGGHPGAGKSTLLLEILCKLAEQQKALYVTGEE